MADFIKVAKVSDIQEGQMKGYSANGEEILIANIGGKFYAMDAVCSHEEGPLPEGQLEDHIVTCPWHGARFDVRTAKVQGTPWASDLRTFEVKIEGEDILVKV